MRFAARCRRATTFAISFPSVVGQQFVHGYAIALGPRIVTSDFRQRAINGLSSVGNITLSRAVFNIMPC